MASTQVAQGNDQWVEAADHEIIAEGIASTISRTFAFVDLPNDDEDGDDEPQPQWVAIKTATTVKTLSKEPHDIIKEARIMKDMRNDNIIEVLDTLNDSQQGILSIWMPYIPYELVKILDSPQFTPTSADFPTLTKSIIHQLFRALDYLHEEQKIAHRDIKPGNVLIDTDGTVKLIDFGVSWKEESDEEKKKDLWPEPKEGKGLYFEVSTGAYRAPELLFGTRSYNAFAIDRWSLGCTIAEFFTTLEPEVTSPTDPYSPFTPGPGAGPISIPTISSYTSSALTRHIRSPLFVTPIPSSSDLALISSIFRTLGTPNEETWPGFQDLPDAQRVEWKVFEATGTKDKLNSNVGDEGILDIIQRLLVYPPEKRLDAKTALEHSWFGGVVRPGEEEGKTLGEMLLDIF